MKSLLVFPKDTSDEALKFARQCALIVSGILDSAGSTKKEIQGDSVTENSIVNALVKYIKCDGNFLAFGHGGPDRFTVHQDQTPVFFLRNTVNLNNLVCYFLCCCTAKKLGPKAIKDGALAFIGFKEEFEFIPGYETDFIECSTSGILQYLTGKCGLDKIEEITKQSFENKVAQLMLSQEYRAAGHLLLDLSLMAFLMK